MKKNLNNEYDLIVIGAGSGGVRAARIAASHGAKVLICESSRIGGTCVMRGCIPKKLLVYGANYFNEIEDSKFFGWEIDSFKHNWSKLINAKEKELNRLESLYKKLLKEAGVEILESYASLDSPDTVFANNQFFKAKNIFLAVGSKPKIPNILGSSLGITSNEALTLNKRPDSLIIVGGGYIAIEFACLFNALGTKVKIVYRGEKILNGFDLDIRDNMTREMEELGIDIICNANVTKVLKKENTKKKVFLSNNTESTVDEIMFAIGRNPATENLGIEKLGIRIIQNNAIKVDENLSTNIPGIYALGDVTDRVNLTPVAVAEGHALSDSIFSRIKRKVSLQYIPSAVFGIPNIGTVGPTEEELIKKNEQFDVYIEKFKPLKHTLTNSKTVVMMKMIVNKKNNRVLALHMVGENSPEIIQLAAVAIKAGATKFDFDTTIGIHPTVAEEFVTMRNPIRSVN